MLNPRYITIKEFMVDSPVQDPKGIFLLAHGAGKGMANPFGKREEVQQRILSKSIEYHWLADGDHNFKPRKISGRTLDENMEDAIQASNRFIKRLL